MAQIPFSANLSAAYYPFLSRWKGRTVIVPGQDEFYIARTAIQTDGNDASKDEGIAHIYYSENVMPSANGFQSIGFIEQLAAYTGETSFDDLFFIRDINENKYLFSPANGKNYVYNANFGGWLSLSGPNASLVTVAYINGLTYIFFSGVGCYQYNSTTNTLDAVVLTGVTAANLKGICASSGYLICWDDFSVYRSQPTSILNFTPDPAQGSGSSIPQDLKGAIVACLPIFGGFLIYTTKNVVAASFTQNIRYPFTYKEVPGSAGIQNPRQVSWQENIGSHFAWTQAGLLQISKTQAQGVHNPVTDFLTAGILETFDYINNTLTENKLSGPMQVRVSVIAQSWLVISYGVDAYTHALIYDLNYKRWGKIQIPHACSFELVLPNLNGTLGWNDLSLYSWIDLSTSSWTDLGTQVQTYELPNTGLAFLGIDGKVTTVDFSEIGQTHSGVAFLGKYQWVRDRWLTVEELEIECHNPNADFECYLIPTYDGKTLETPVLLADITPAGLSNTYNSEVQGKNITVLCKGTFHIINANFLFKLEGKR